MVISFLIVLIPQRSLKPQDFVIMDLDYLFEYAHLQLHKHLYPHKLDSIFLSLDQVIFVRQFQLLYAFIQTRTGNEPSVCN